MPTSINYLKQMLLNKNIQAAMKTVRHTEGTTDEGGYKYLFGSSPSNSIRFQDFSTHPNIQQNLNGYKSTAAGAYQILHPTYVGLLKTYGIKDGFTPADQDLLFVAILDSVGVLNDVSKGYMFRDDVMSKLSSQWASLPFSNSGQPKHSIADVRKYYIDGGGVIGSAA